MSIFKTGLIGKTPPGKFKDIIDHLTRVKKKKPDFPDVFPASKAPIPTKTKTVEDIEAINRFVRDNPRQDMAGGGMLVQPGFGGTRQGYAKDKREITTKVINKLDLDKKKITLSGDDFITGKVKSFVPEGVGKKYVDEYINFANKNYLKNDMSMVEPFQAYIKNKYPKRYAKIISDVNESGYRDLKNIHITYKRALANELITAANNQLKFVNQFDILKKLIPPKRVGFYEKKGGLQARPPKWADKNTLNNFKNLDKMENKLSKALTYMVKNNVTIIDPKKVKIKGSGANKPGASPIRLTMHYLVGGGSENALNKALEINPWYQSQNFKVGDTTKNTFNYLSKQYGKDFIGQPFNDAYDFALQRRGRISLKGMKNQPLPENLIWEFAARSAQRNFNDGVPIDQWPVTILDKKGDVVDLGKFPVDSTGRKILNTSELQFKYNGEIFNRKNLKTKGVQSGFFNDIYKVSSNLDSYLKQQVPDPDNPKKTISLKELFDKTEGRIFPTIGHDDARGGVKKRPFNNFKILTNVENISLYNAYDKITNPETRRNVANFIYGETKGLRGDRYKEAWTNKNVKFVTEYIKTGQGLGQTPYRQAVTMPPERLQRILASFSKNRKCIITFGKSKAAAEGGRIGYVTGSANLTECAKDGAKVFNDGKLNTADQIQDGAKLLRGGRAVLSTLSKYGIVPELAYVGLEAAGRTVLGEEPANALLKSIDTLTFGATDFTSEIEAEKFGEYAKDKLAVDAFRGSQAKVRSILNNLEKLEQINLEGGDVDVTQELQTLRAQLKSASDELRANTVNPDLVQFIDKRQEEISDVELAKSPLAKKSLTDQLEGFPGIKDYMDTEATRVFPFQQTQKQLNEKVLTSLFDVKDAMQYTTSDAINIAQRLRAEGQDISAKDILDYRDSLRNTNLSGLAESGKYSPTSIYGANETFSTPLPSGALDKKPNVIPEIEREIVGQTNVVNPFDIDISDIGSGLRGFAAAGGGIAKEAGDRSGRPPERGPNSQGLQGLMKRVRNL